MSPWLFILCVLCPLCVLAAAACRAAPPAAPPPLVAQVSGTIEIDGLGAPVRVVRDRWGVPHLYAQSAPDLFVAQGFVQAQDRLFQMDLWRRSAQGRLAEVLGPNFIERDAMTRRVQYRGDLDAEWASYGPDARAIATAFVRGVNAWVALARERPPEEFTLAGWTPEFWSPVDLLNRTDAFVQSGDALDEVQRQQLSEVVADAVRRVGAPPFFAGFRANSSSEETLMGAVSHAGAARDGVLSFSEARRELTSPSPRYFVHLHAPAWNVIGATAPWLPAVAMGHNDRIAWGMSPIDVDTQDIYIDDVAGARGVDGATVIHDAIVVKGRRAPFAFDTSITPHGVVIASDREHDRAFALRWSGAATGAAAELGAVALDRASNWSEFRAALERWKMPARRMVYADADGNVAFQDAALVPRRSSRKEWQGWLRLDDLPHAFNRRTAIVSHPARSATQIGAQARFDHLLAVTDAARRRYRVGPLNRPSDDSAVRATLDPRHWDRSVAMNAPGQSESPTSPHFSDLAALWSAGKDFALPFSDEAVAASASATLIIVPRKKQAPRR